MTYTAFDRFVAWCRFRAVLPHIRPQARVCDIGCGPDAPFLHYARGRIGFGVGIDDHIAATAPTGGTLIRGDITQGLPFRSGCFDHAVLLAVLEHLSHPQPLLTEIFRILMPGGSLIMTWPAAAIDPLIRILDRVGMVSKELGSHEHQPRIPLPLLLSMLGEIRFSESRHRTFELGFNNLLVCFKPPAGSEIGAHGDP
jgi:SAM-dependent methyltransferase